MKPLVSDHIDAILPYVPGKRVEELERELGIRGAVKLASNENPHGPSPRAVEAAKRAAAQLHVYPDDQAHDLKQRIAALHGVHSSEIAIGHGSNELIDLIARTFASEREHALVGVPSFSCYALCLGAARVPFSSVPLRDALFWDVDAVRAALKPETKLLFIDHPGNPSSTHIPRDELRALLSELPSDIVVVVDEAYADFATAPDFVSALALRSSRERLIVLRTFSKAYGLAALRLGYAVANPQLVDYVQRVRVPFNANSVAQAAALAALEDREHLRMCVEHNTRERLRVTAALEALGLYVAPSQANFVCVHIDRPAAQAYQALLRRGVIVRPFGPPLHRHLRISIGLAHENDRMLAELPGVLAALPA